MEQALGLPRTPGVRARHTLIVTDAEVSDSGRILLMASEEAHQAERRRINVICIDTAPMRCWRQNWPSAGEVSHAS